MAVEAGFFQYEGEKQHIVADLYIEAGDIKILGYEGEVDLMIISSIDNQHGGVFVKPNNQFEIKKIIHEEKESVTQDANFDCLILLEEGQEVEIKTKEEPVRGMALWVSADEGDDDGEYEKPPLIPEWSRTR